MGQVTVDVQLSVADQVSLMRATHDAELLLAERLADASRRRSDRQSESEATYRLERNDAERLHREAISVIQIEQLALRLAVAAGQQED